MTQENRYLPNGVSGEDAKRLLDEAIQNPELLKEKTDEWISKQKQSGCIKSPLVTDIISSNK